MQIEQLDIDKRQINILKNKGMDTVEKIMELFPNKYLYFDKVHPLIFTGEVKEAIASKKPIAVIGKCIQVENEYKTKIKKSLIKIRVKEKQTEKTLFVNMIGAYKMFPYYKNMEEHDVIVGGIMQYSEEYHSFSMLNPLVFSTNINKYQKILPVYKKFKGISEEYYEKIIKYGYDAVKKEDILPQELIAQYGIYPYYKALNQIHYPLSEEDIENARKRFIFEDILYFTCKLEHNKQNTDMTTNYRLLSNKVSEVLRKLQTLLPYTLTDGQKRAISEACKNAENGKKITALLQGDVGAGKTIVAIALMLAFAECGYQSVIMAPTAVLAKQHYKEINTYAAQFGFQTAFLINGLSASERKAALSDIASGDAQIIVGTHSLLSDKVVFHKLALSITDEEHKFGVVQRETLKEKYGNGIHVITMSATPIPRTMANVLYGESVSVYTLERPKERKPVKTMICSSDKAIFDFCLKEIQNGHQCYVVCPLIDEAQDGTSMQGVSSVEEIAHKYKKYFEPLGIKQEVLTGKIKKEEQQRIIQDFADHKFQILIATTVIEVGVNVPNATVIVISGAERFGLATLHQLRGRVGRSNLQSYCILQKSESVEFPANNMQILCGENDGYKIAEADLKNRGSGNIIGIEQSGKNNFINLMFAYPNMYNKTKEIAKRMCSTNQGIQYINAYEAVH